MRTALRAGVAPSRYLRHLGLPHLAEHGETDALLVMAVHQLESMVCPCGCGQYIDQCHNEATRGRWQINLANCYAGQARAQFLKDHHEDMEPGTVLSLSLLPDGEDPVDPLDRKYDPEQARKNYEAHMAKWGVTPE